MEHGLLAEYESPDELLVAAQLLRRRGYAQLDAFTPCPVPGLEEVLGLKRSPLNWIVFPISLGGAFFAYILQWYCNASSYRLNVGGRPAHAAPAFIPITFETVVLFTSICSLLLLAIFLRLPRLSHPMFDVEGFERASRDRYWLAVDALDPQFERARTTADLHDAGAKRIEEFGEARG